MRKQISRILVPTDFSDQSRAAFEYALFLAERMNAPVDLLHVWEAPRYVSPDLMLAVPGWSAVTVEQFSRAQAGKELEAFLAKVDRHGVAVKPVLEVGDPSVAICRAAKAMGADLVVMGTHGRAGLARLFLGSVAEKVVTHSEVPVLTIKLPDGASLSEPAEEK